MAKPNRAIRWIKAISFLLIMASLAALAVYYLPFPWYVHSTKPLVYYEASGSPAEETGVLEVEGWMLCYLYKQDRFYGSMEVFMSDATFQRGQYKAKMRIKFDEDPNPDVELAEGYRTIHFDKIECTGDTQTFVDYWMNAERSPIVFGRFKQVILQKTLRSGGKTIIRSYAITDAKSAAKAQNVLMDFREANPDYPILPTE